jgi:hypothetical protein
MPSSKVLDPNCSIARSLGVLGELWTFLILREAMDGVTRFAQFRDALGIAPDVLTDRLTTLVDYGVMSRAPYQEPEAVQPGDLGLIRDRIGRSPRPNDVTEHWYGEPVTLQILARGK